jgi:RNA polymerase sigma-70 factor (ECF subfamily)
MAGRGSFDEFYAGAVGRLVGQLFPVTGDLHEAEEVVQEALTPAPDGTEVRWHAGFDAPPGFGWIYVAALRRFTWRLLGGLSRRVVTVAAGPR